jgi:glycogen debranching enzyme
VWPHDNALCAAGLARYGLRDHAQRVIDAQLDVAAAHAGRLPELFAGFGRDELSVPAAYPTSCSPQAWAAASPLLWLRTMLGLDPWVPRNQVWLAPHLPPSIGRLHVSGIKIGQHRVTIEVDGSGGPPRVEGLGDLALVETPRPPLTSLLTD